MDKAMDGIDHLAWEQREVKKLQSQLEALDAEIQQHQEMRLSVYEDLKNGLIDKSEYENLRRGFSSRIEEAKKAKQELRGEQNTLLCGLNDQQEFLKSFREFANIQVLERNMVVALIDRVEVLDGSNINVDFRYEDRFASIEEFLGLQQKKDKLHVLKRREA
jgi:multidrug resistance efflux pump